MADVAAAIRDKPVELPDKSYPLLVTFTDINDPKTVKRVESNDLDASFGAGYSLKSNTLEITDEPVTKGMVEGVLPCLNSGKACIPFNGNLPYGNSLRNFLNSSFWRHK